MTQVPEPFLPSFYKRLGTNTSRNAGVHLSSHPLTHKVFGQRALNIPRGYPDLQNKLTVEYHMGGVFRLLKHPVSARGSDGDFLWQVELGSYVTEDVLEITVQHGLALDSVLPKTQSSDMCHRDQPWTFNYR